MGQVSPVRFQITLGKLQEAGAAAVRAVRWVEGADHAARAQLERFARRASSRPRGEGGELPKGFERVRPRQGDPREAAVIIRHRSESWRADAEASWSMAIRRSEDKPVVTARIGLPVRGGLVLQADLQFPEVLAGEAERTSPRPARPGRGRAGDVAVVAVDPSWSDGPLRESAMAQLAEWWVKTGGHLRSPPGAIVELSADALAWWSRWTQPSMGQDDAARLSGAYDVAERSPTPRTPAGHRKYWSKSRKRWWSDAYRDVDTVEPGPSPGSFRLVGGDIQVRYPAELNEAIRILGIARSTAYARLQRGGRTIQEFLQRPDPLGALVDFLSAQAPRRISEQSREILAALKAAGMKENSARRLERRTRELPPKERNRRIQAALRRIPAARRPARQRREVWDLDLDALDAAFPATAGGL